MLMSMQIERMIKMIQNSRKIDSLYWKEEQDSVIV